MANGQRFAKLRGATSSPQTRKAGNGAPLERGHPVDKRIVTGLPAGVIPYNRADGVQNFVRKISEATPMQLVETERSGVSGMLLKDLARQINIPVLRLYDIVGVPKATAEKKASGNGVVRGAGGQAAISIARLLGIAQTIVGNSTLREAKDFDTARWLGEWIELPQASLGGHKPADLLDTPTGFNAVAKVLGAIESGAFV